MSKIVELYHNLIRRYWEIGVASFSEDVINENHPLDIRWIRNPFENESWFADPFILLENEDEFVILVEEFPFTTAKGRISRLIVSKSEWQITDVKVLLELDTHLSFPCYFRREGKVYIYPENSASGTSTIYVYDERKEELSPIGTLNENPLTDAVIYDIEGCKFVLSTQHPRENKNQLDVYRLDGLKSESTPCQTITFTENIARNAGISFLAKGKLIRPAQISNHGYGEGLVLQEVEYTAGKFEFTNLRRLYSPLHKCPLAFHTMNVFEDRYIIYDAQGYKHPVLGPMVDSVATFTKNILKK